MSGIVAIRYLLANDAELTAVVPSSRIKPGNLPLKTLLPAISLRQISSVPQNLINTNDPNRVHTDRVQVTAHFNDPSGATAGTGYPGLKAAMKLILAACPSQYGSINGVQVHSIQPQFEGPDFQDESIHTCSRDFMVKWSES